MINDSIDIQVRKMKVITVINIFIFYCATAPPSFSAVQPSTFGGFVNSFGRLTNTIKDTQAWKRFSDLQMKNPRSMIFPRAMIAMQDILANSLRTEDRLVVHTKSGALRGRFTQFKTGESGGYYSFQGIKYGKAPVGNRRFRAALPEDPWTGIRLAWREGPSCPHRNMILENFNGNEDCLYINVYTPKLPKFENSSTSEKLPVLFWIHGGAFNFGNGNSFMYGPDYLLTENVILVTFNYRLGVLGFLNTGTEDAPGNAGLKDQILALRWTRDNIKAFGGDPNNITIGGQSAGAASVHYLTLSKLTKGLYKRAIAQSGVTLNPWSMTSNPQERAFMLAKQLNFVTNDTEKLVQFLKRAKPQQLVNAAPKTLTEEDARANIGFVFVPSLENPNMKRRRRRRGDGIDDYDLDQPLFTEDPHKMLREGRFNRVPLLMGYNANEAMLFLRRYQKDKSLLNSYENDFNRLIPIDLNVTNGRFSSEGDLVADRIRDFYLAGRPITEETAEEMIAILTDELFVRGIVNVAKIRTKFVKNSTYVYRFGYDGALGLYKRLLNVNRPGVCHGDELGYLFYFGIFNVKIDPSSSEALTKKRLVRMWTNFIKYGDPTPLGKDDNTLGIKWEPVNASSKNDIPYLDFTSRLEMRKNPEAERMEFWDDLYDQYNSDLM